MNIKSLRTASNMTQEQLANALEIDRSTVAKWETGDSMPRASMLPQLAEILGCTVDELFTVQR